jgi:hypothetical protein
MDNQAFQLLLERLKEQDSKLGDIEVKLEELLAWKWKLAGATLVISGICGLVVQIVLAKIGSK